MPKVTFTQQDGSSTTVEVDDGQTILQAAMANNVEMAHACGGSGFCTTCICAVEEGQKALDDGRVSPVNEKEKNMGVEGPDERLGCQAQVLGDLTVKVGE